MKTSSFKDFINKNLEGTKMIAHCDDFNFRKKFPIYIQKKLIQLFLSVRKAISAGRKLILQSKKVFCLFILAQAALEQKRQVLLPAIPFTFQSVIVRFIWP